MSETKKKLDPVAELILEMIATLKPGRSITPNQVAEEFAIRQWLPASPPPGEWRKFLDTAKHQALYLARQKRLTLLRKGRPVDPTHPIKGLFRLTILHPLPPVE